MCLGCRLEDHFRVIPAWAGNRVSAPDRPHEAPGHPRVGGEQSRATPCKMLSNGSSPRGRGTVRNRVIELACKRVIPAWAGNRQTTFSFLKTTTGHPRVGGEQFNSHQRLFASSGSSPRGRGTGPGRYSELLPRRVIPAWAGNRETCALSLGTSTGHPRVGGEQRCPCGCVVSIVGSSPRGRGTEPRLRPSIVSPRVIPAWAGNS
mgnify:CR=1 FL=1